MKMKTKLLMIIAMVVLLVLAGCAQAPVEDESIKIGWISALTGRAAIYGLPAMRAATMAVEDINAKGGINGKQIELIIEDTECNGAKATSAARKLIDVDGVKYLLAGHCSPESMAVLPVVKEAGDVFMLAGLTGTDDFTNAYKYAFRTFPTASVFFSRLAEIAYEKDDRKVVTFNEETDWAQSASDAFVSTFTSLGGKVLMRESFPSNNLDFKTPLLKLDQKKADAFVITVQSPASAAQILKEMNQLGMDYQIYGGVLVVSTAANKLSGGLLPETALGVGPHVDLEKNPKTKEFYQRFISRFDEPTFDPFSITESYDTVFILAGLIENCGEDIACARTTLLSKEWNFVTGPFKFEDNGNANPYIGILKVVDGEIVFPEEYN